MQFINIRKQSFGAIIFIIAFILAVFSYYNLWSKSRLTVDAPSYYAYMPAMIIHQDLHLTYIDKDREYYKDKVWFIRLPGKGIVLKNPIGTSILLSPFFLAGHVTALICGDNSEGYSMIYQNACSLGVLFYLFIGLVFLRRFLLFYFSENVVALSLISIVLGTNLLWYSSFEGFMSHSITFSLICIHIYMYHQWLATGRRIHLVIFACIFGLLLLIRPLSILFILFFLMYTYMQKDGTKGFLAWLKLNYKQLLLAGFLASAIAFIQPCYLKYATGQWFYDVYGEEHFLFNSPQIWPFLFGFRKGVFIYAPVLLFALAGLVIAFKKQKPFFYAILTLLIVAIYLLSSWWAWTYGISWGMRPTIDYYPFFCILMCVAFDHLVSKGKTASVILYSIVTLLVFFSLFQTWQYKNGLIHYDDMSTEAYLKGLFQTEKTDEWTDLLKPYDWERRLKGLDQINYSRSFFNTLTPDQRVYLRAPNIAFITVNSKAQNAMAALAKDYSLHESFYISHLKGDTIAIQSSDGLFWSYKPYYEDAITASEPVIGPYEKFTFEYLKDSENQVIIKAANGQPVSYDNQWPFIIKAGKDGVSKNEVFRYFIYDNK